MFGGLLGAAAFLLLPVPEGLVPQAWHLAAVVWLMALWWMGEVVPLAVTGLLPLLLFPLLGIASLEQAAAPFAHPLIFLFLGGFCLALAIEDSGLHRRLGLTLLALAGPRPARLVAAFLLTSAFLSLWLSNTATALMLLPLATSVLRQVSESAKEPLGDLCPAVLLVVAHGATLGGMGTLIGTPPNALLAGYLAEAGGGAPGFAQWMAFALPLTLALLAIVWLFLTRLVLQVPRGHLPQVAEGLKLERASLGPWSQAEKRVAIVVASVALCWITRPIWQVWLSGIKLDDSWIAVFGAVVLFLLPDGRGRPLLQWDSTRRLPWGVLLLLGGGLSLAEAMGQSGLSDGLTQALTGLGGLPQPLLVLASVTLIVLVSELASNTATAAVFLPLLGSLALAADLPVAALAVPGALAASCAFMLPVATPPNTLVYSTGLIRVGQMVRVGFWMNLASALLITLAALYWWPVIMP